MKYEEKVKRMFPAATLDRVMLGDRGKGVFRVTIKPGRYTYGRMRSWAWREAFYTINQDKELIGEAVKIDPQEGPRGQREGEA